MRKIRILIFIMMLNVPIQSFAKDFGHYVNDIIMVEMIASLWSWLPRHDVIGPASFGWTLVATTPITLLNVPKEDHSLAFDLTYLLIFEGIGYYNISIQDKNYTDEEIFWNNMLAFHIGAGVAFLSNYLFGDEGLISYAPLEDGGMLYYSYKF